MKEILRALRPVRRRLRWGNALRSGSLGLLMGAGLSLALLILSFFVPVAGKLRLCAFLIAGPGGLGLLAGLCRPVRPMTAARAADRAGLQERAQTALALQGDEAMAQLQHDDALRALWALDPRRIPLPRLQKRLLAAGGAVVLSAALLLLPNAQDEAARRIAAFRAQMNQAAEQLAAEAEKQEDDLTDAQRQELRRLLQELSRELRRADTPLNALLALDRGEQRLEQLREASAAQAQSRMMDALRQTGLSALAEALSAGDENALADALAQTDPAQLNQAAENLSGALQSALQTAAQALQNGDGQQARSALSQMQSAGQQGQSGQMQSASQLMQALRAAASGQTAGRQQGQAQGDDGKRQGQGQGADSGQGQGQGQENKNGGGAGSGSTNEDQGAFSGNRPGQSAGSRAPEYKEEKYEEIYDPTRLRAAETQQTAQNARGAGEADQVQLGPGAGMQGDSVPYNEVVNEYASAAAQAAESQRLTRQERQWVDDYFAALTQDGQ